MKHRYIHKGIGKRITAISSRFQHGSYYTAAIYNMKDSSVKITDTKQCVTVDGKNTLLFVFTDEQTDQLRVGYATIEIYDSSMTTMAVAENFAIIRKNSLHIEEAEETVES